MGRSGHRQYWRYALLATALTSPAYAIDLEFGDIEGSATVSLSAGVTLRAQERDATNVGKSANNPTVCNRQAALGRGCLDDGSEAEFFATPGRFNQNADNGNVQFDKGDVAYSAIKSTIDLSLNWEDFGIFARTITVFDPVNAGDTTYHPQNFDTDGLQPTMTERSFEQEEAVGFSSELEDLYISGNFEIADHSLTVKLGSQRVAWGEQLILVPHSLNSINAPNLIRLHTPGFDLKELFDPVEMAYMNLGLNDEATLEAFYMLNWRGVNLDPIASLNSPADAIGAGNKYGMLSFSRAPEDPDNLADTHPYNGAGNSYGTAADGTTIQQASGRGCMNPDTITSDAARRQSDLNFDRQGNGHRGSLPGGGGQIAGRTLCVAPDREPDDDGQFGISLNYFSEAFNDTEFRLYYMNYHSRFPMVGFYASDANVGGAALPDVFRDIVDIADLTPLQTLTGVDSDGLSDVLTLVDAFNQVDTASLVFDYPENLRMMGFSFNTTLGDLSISGEYAYHQNRPLQLDTTDLTYFALAPAFGSLRRNNTNVGLLNRAPGDLGDYGIGAAPSFIELYRGGSNNVDDIGLDCDGGGGTEGQPTNLCPGQYIRGYERFPVGQGDIVVLSVVSQNPFGADQWIRVFEAGYTKVFGMPGFELDAQQQPVSGLVFAGPGVDTHPSLGRDSIRNGESNGAGGNYESLVLVAGDGNPGSRNEADVNTSAVIQNPTAARHGYPTSFSWGIRHLSIFQYNNLIFDLNFKPIVGIFWDVNGISPSPGGNHIEGRKTFLVGTDIEKGSIAGNITYFVNTGGGTSNLDRDKDTLSLSLRYQF